MALDCCGGYHKEELVCAFLPLECTFIFFIFVHSAFVLDSYAHKAGQTEFAVYRHRPHGFSDFPKIFQISDPVQ